MFKSNFVSKMVIIYLVAISPLYSNASASTPATSLVPVPVTHIFSPSGFDSNDNTEVVVTGYLPNLCYKAQRSTAKVVGKHVQVNVQALVSTAPVYCAMMTVPFIEVTNLGVMDQGMYDITANKKETNVQKSEIKITESTSAAIDDFVYANVESVERIPGTQNVVLKGTNPSDCYVLDEVKSVSNGKDTYSVLPIMKKVKEVCAQVLVPFTYEYQVPTDLSAETILLHVRVMNGKSVNMLYSQKE